MHSNYLNELRMSVIMLRIMLLDFSSDALSFALLQFLALVHCTKHSTYVCNSSLAGQERCTHSRQKNTVKRTHQAMLFLFTSFIKLYKDIG